MHITRFKIANTILSPHDASRNNQAIWPQNGPGGFSTNVSFRKRPEEPDFCVSLESDRRFGIAGVAPYPMNAYIVGAGAQGRVILDILRAQHPHDTIEFIDENRELWGTVISGANVRGCLAQALAQPHAGVGMIVALGNPVTRMSIAASIRAAGIALLNAIHPSAVVAPSSQIGNGNMIAALAVVNSNARVENDVVINTGAIVEHDCVVEDGSAVSPGARVGGRVTVGRGAFIGSGATILSRIRIGAGAIVGAGAVVTRDVPPNVLVKGVPARSGGITRDLDWKRIL